jgi:hypothetical protein
MAITVKFVHSSSVRDEEIWVQFVSGSVAGTGNSNARVATCSTARTSMTNPAL